MSSRRDHGSAGWVIDPTLTTLLLCGVCLMSTPVNAAEPKTGPWHAWFDSPGGELPIGMTLEKTKDGWASQIINGPERIKVPTTTWDGKQLVLDID